MSRNALILDNSLARDGLREFQRRLPPNWRVGEPAPRKSSLGVVVKVTAPNRRSGSITIETRARLDPKGVLSIVEAAQNVRSPAPLIVISRYLSEATRARLRERDVGYLDLTGNARIVLPEPGLFIETQGASEDPDREERPARSLRGAKAGRIVRTLIDLKEPPGVRELATMTNINAGYVSRVLAFLDSQALVTRIGRGRIQTVDWPALLRRWAQEAPLDSRGQARTFLEPRGANALLTRLAESKDRYAITGSLAAASFAPASPTRLVTIWIRDAAEAGTRLSLRPTEAGANVLLIEPSDEGVFEGAAQRNGVWYAAPSQIATDLLTSPGRGPAEGEELMKWMLANEEAWRQ